jgi:large repetitive protein
VPPLGSTNYFAVFDVTQANALSGSGTPASVVVTGGKTQTSINPAPEKAAPYTLSATVEGLGSRTLPGGAGSEVTFQNASKNFAAVATATLGAPTVPPAVSLGVPTVCSSYSELTVRNAVADFNKDGIPDVAMLSNGSDGLTPNVSICLGNGDGTLRRGATLALPTASDAWGIVAGDFRNSGNLDLAIVLLSGKQLIVVQGNGNGTFKDPKAILLTDGRPYALAAGDFDGDGTLDLVIANQGVYGNAALKGNVQFLKGDGKLGFAAKGAPVTLTNPWFIAPADLDGDGVLDLAVVEQGTTQTAPGSLTVLKGAGNGTFTLPSWGKQEVDNFPYAPVIDDFNGDGIPDILVPSYTASSATMFLASKTSTLTYTRNVLSNLTPGTIRRVAAADFDRDGNTDFAIGDSTNAVRVFQGKGDGTTFTALPQGPVAVGNFISGLAAADFNSDGIADLLALTYYDNSAEIIPVTLATPVPATTPAQSVIVIGSGPADVVAGYSGDAVYAGSTSEAYDALMAQQQATKTALDQPDPAQARAGESVTFTAHVTPGRVQGVSPTGVVTFTANPGNKTLGTYTLQDSSQKDDMGTAQISVSPNLAVGPYTVTASYAGDGNFGPSASTPGQSLTINTPPLPTQVSLAIPNSQTGALATLTATVTQAGKPVTAGTVNFCSVLASTCTGAALIGSVQIDEATGKATLETYLVGQASNWFRADFLGTPSALPGSSLTEPWTLQPVAKYPTSTVMTPDPRGNAGNLTLFATVTSKGGKAPFAQGIVDFVDASNKSCDVAPLGACLIGTAALGRPTPAQLGFGTEFPAVGLTATKPTSIAAADFNGDGHLDMAIGSNTNFIYLQQGKGDGTFAAFPAPSISVGGQQYVAAADFNNDGKVDLMVSGGYFVSVAKGGGDGTFNVLPAVYNNTADQTATYNTMTIADFNGDGLLDAALTNNAGGSTTAVNKVTVLLNQGNLVFKEAPGSPYSLDAGAQLGAIVAQDFDGDGIADLAVAETAKKSYVVLKGKGGGTFAPYTPGSAIPMNPPHAPASMVVGDFNNDGHPDLAIADYDTNVSVMYGNGNLTFNQTDYKITGAAANATIGGIAVGDIDGDGYQDIAAGDSKNGTVSVLLAPGGVTQPPLQATSGVAAGSGGFTIMGAFDESGLLNAATAFSATQGARIVQPLVTATAVAELDHAQVAPGKGNASHDIGAHYEGNDQYQPSDATGKLPPVPPAPLTDKLVVTATPGVLRSGSLKTFLGAQIVPTPPGATTQGHAFSGTVQFKNMSDGGSALCTPAEVNPANGSAGCTVQGSTFLAGENDVEADYSGDANFAPASGTVTVIGPPRQPASSSDGSPEEKTAPLDAPVIPSRHPAKPTGMR